MKKTARPPRHPRLATIRKIAAMPAYEDAFTVSALRHLVFQATLRLDSKGRPLPTNGLDEAGVIIRIGRKVLFDLDRFDQWIDSHRN